MMKSVTFRRFPAIGLRAESGFTLLEMMIVVAIVLIVGAFAIVNGMSAAQSFRLSEATTNYSNLLQQARISAIKDDTFYTVLTDPAKAFINVNGPLYVVGDPMMAFPSGVTPMTYSSGPNETNLEAQFLPAGAHNTLNLTAAGPIFGPRGLPCKPTPGANPTCPSLAQPTSYITFFQNSQSQKWAAVTVSPAGRIRRWSYDGSSWEPVN
jgi:prepilin-type N-terminal cleavage/methylation domain-containing protein